MRRTVFVLCAVFLLSTALVDSFADGPVQKLGRGIANVVTCPLELFKGMSEAGEEKGFFASATWGVLLGALGIVKRAAVGVYEIATFPIPLPAEYRPILDDPEFFMESKETSRL